MKRRIGEIEEGRVSHLMIYYSGPSISYLPNSILVTILLGLPINTIFVCKCVCKAWYNLISDPDFAILHFNQAQVYPLLLTWRFTLLSRMLHLVQPDDFDMCHDRSPINIKLDFKLKLPPRNIEMILDQEGVESKNCLKLNMQNHKYNIVNSCNGLLCLSNTNSCNNDPVIVCNPVTGEFINLPEVRTVPKRRMIECSSECGFGFSPVTNHYKVIRMYYCSNKQNTFRVAEVHTLGTETWKAVRLLPESLPKSSFLSCPTYLNGSVYWLSYDHQQVYFVTCFDIGMECFESIPIPTSFDFYNVFERKNIGVLGGELFISNSGFNGVRVWAMKDNGANKSWSQIFSFQSDKFLYSSYDPIKYLNNGALLLFDSCNNVFICNDPRKTGFKCLKVHGCGSKVKVITHIPSFVPLKYVLSGHNVKVLNVKSRCAELKLHREEQVISIVEENWNLKCDFEDMDQKFDSE